MSLHTRVSGLGTISLLISSVLALSGTAFANPQSIGPFLMNQDEIVESVAGVNLQYTLQHPNCGAGGQPGCNPNALSVLAVGKPRENNFDGELRLVAIRDGEQFPAGLVTTKAGASMSRFGARVKTLEMDCTSDGIDELLVSAPNVDEVHLIDPTDLGSASYAILTSPTSGEQFGSDIAIYQATPTLAFVAIGAFQGSTNNRGKAYVYQLTKSGGNCSFNTVNYLEFDAALASTISTQAKFGEAVANAEDLDGDGYPELVISAPRDRDPAAPTDANGEVFVYDGAAVFNPAIWPFPHSAVSPTDATFQMGSSIRCLDTGANPDVRWCGFQIGTTGDILWDGKKSLYVSAPQENGPTVPQAGRLYLYDWDLGISDWVIIKSFGEDEDKARLGFGVAVVGDWRVDANNPPTCAPTNPSYPECYGQLMLAVGSPGAKAGGGIPAEGRIDFKIMHELKAYDVDGTGAPQFTYFHGGSSFGLEGAEQGHYIDVVDGFFPNGSLQERSPLSGIVSCGPADDAGVTIAPSGIAAEPPQPQAIINQPTGNGRVAANGQGCENPPGNPSDYAEITVGYAVANSNPTVYKNPVMVYGGDCADSSTTSCTVPTDPANPGTQCFPASSGLTPVCCCQNVTILSQSQFAPNEEIRCGVGSPIAPPVWKNQVKHWEDICLQGAGELGNHDGLQFLEEECPDHDYCGTPPCLEPNNPVPSPICDIGVAFSDYSHFDIVLQADSNGNFDCDTSVHPPVCNGELPIPVKDGLVYSIQCIQAYGTNNRLSYEASTTNRVLWAAGAQ